MKKNLKSYKIMTDDTLPKIAIRFNCSISDLRSLNQLSNDYDLYARHRILVPINEDSERIEPPSRLFTSDKSLDETRIVQTPVEIGCIEKVDKILETKYKSECKFLFLSAEQFNDSPVFDQSLIVKKDESIVFIPNRKHTNSQNLGNENI
ncbi:hypothetical protein RF11_10175 [Thelohanellus kitauei]|uniref:LysM domain-containing protein n=1 Tax=Thelohanellus kitauei TaxID=669202 RepID=A0A0C2MNS5_THEKT|nr:hypothetical protein RF11_10175 [Thelohanellus kitauei]